MTQPPDDGPIRRMYRELRDDEAARAPSFDAIMGRTAERRPWWRKPALPIGLGLALSGAAAAALVLVISTSSALKLDAGTEMAVQDVSRPKPEPLAGLLTRPGRDPEAGLRTPSRPGRRLLGGWE